MNIQTVTRNTDLQNLVGILKQQQDVKYDVVANASDLVMENGILTVRNGAARITDTGVASADALLRPTNIFWNGIADRLNIPARYIHKMNDAEKLELLDTNVNSWMQDTPDKRWFVRGFRTDDPDQIGMARAFLSDQYRVTDNLDCLMAVLDGIRSSGVQAEVISADLTDSRMHVSIVAPEIEALAPVLLENYRTPFDDASPERQAQAEAHGWLAPEDRPVVFAGFVVSNSETGGGAFSITPRLMVKVCRNGLVVTADRLRSVHLGGRMDEGIVKWSDDTQHKNIDLLRAQARDAVTTFLDVEYVRQAITKMEEAAGHQIQQPVKAIEQISKQHGFTKDEQDNILDFFLSSGQRTAAGVLNAVTAVAQNIPDPDRAHLVEEMALDVFATATRI